MIEEKPITIHIPMEDILRRLNILNGFIQLLAHQLDVFRQTSEKLHKEPDGSNSNVFAAFALAIPDLSTSTVQHFNYVHGGAYIKEGEEYFRAGEEFLRNWSAWTIAQSYEAFETFLRDTAAYFFYKTRPQKPIGSLQQIPIDIENIDAWKSYFREHKWVPLSLLNLFRLTEPTIADLEKQNYLQLDLQQWFQLYTSVRHAVTHSNSRLSRLDLKAKASASSIDKILPTFFPGIWTGDIYEINCSENNALNIIQLTGAYAFLIYKKLCSRGDMPLLIDIMK